MKMVQVFAGIYSENYKKCFNFEWVSKLNLLSSIFTPSTCRAKVLTRKNKHGLISIYTRLITARYWIKFGNPCGLTS